MARKRKLTTYPTSRGDKDFKNMPFNSADQLVFAGLSYTFFERFYTHPETLKSIGERILSLGFIGAGFREKGDMDILSSCMKSKVYSSAIVYAPYGSIEESSLKQFGAVTFLFDDFAVVAFRGTDSSFIGWQEDISLSYREVIPAMDDGCNYLKDILLAIDLPIYITGHSKGGTIALFSYLSLSKEEQERVLCVYNNDGPGLCIPRLQRCKDSKVVTIVPESSVVGMLLYHAKEDYVVKASGLGAMQHNLYSWYVSDESLLYGTSRTRFSLFMEKAALDWVSVISFDERLALNNFVFSFLKASGDISFRGFLLRFIKKLNVFVSFLMKAPKEDKKLVKKTIYMFFISIFAHKGIKQIPQEI